MSDVACRSIEGRSRDGIRCVAARISLGSVSGIEPCRSRGTIGCRPFRTALPTAPAPEDRDARGARRTGRRRLSRDCECRQGRFPCLECPLCRAGPEVPRLPSERRLPSYPSRRNRRRGTAHSRAGSRPSSVSCSSRRHWYASARVDGWSAPAPAGSGHPATDDLPRRPGAELHSAMRPYRPPPRDDAS